MPVKIRLSRHGKKGYPFYHIVVADGRAPRDGRYIERLGVYNPNTNPATIEFDFDRALDWLQNGALPSDTCRTILAKKGVFMKKHLLEGAKKGAFSAEVAEQRFQDWMSQKDTKILAEKENVVKTKEEDKKQRFEAEAKVKEAKSQAIAKKLQADRKAAEVAAAPPVEASPEPVAETPAPAAE